MLFIDTLSDGCEINNFSAALVKFCSYTSDKHNYINIGYLSIIVNIPLIILTFFILNRDFALKNTAYIISFFVCSIILSYTDISSFHYITDTGSSIVLAPIIALCSYFVYGMHLEPVICSILYSFITTSANNNISVTSTSNIKYEIIARGVAEFCAEIFEKFHQPTTIIDTHGVYLGLNTKMVVCVVNKNLALH